MFYKVFKLYLNRCTIFSLKERNFYKKDLVYEIIGGSVIPAAVKTPDNKFARIIKSGRNMPAVKTPDKKFA